EVGVIGNLRRSGAILAAALFLILAGQASAQDWFRTGTGLGAEKARVAVADFASRNDAARTHATLFTEVVRNDLQFSGIIELVSPSFYPERASGKSSGGPAH